MLVWTSAPGAAVVVSVMPPSCHPGLKGIGRSADHLGLAVAQTHRGRLLAEMDKLLVLRDGAVEKFGPRRELLAPARPRVAEAAVGSVAGIRPQALER